MPCDSPVEPVKRRKKQISKIQDYNSCMPGKKMGRPLLTLGTVTSDGQQRRVQGPREDGPPSSIPANFPLLVEISALKTACRGARVFRGPFKT